ncbi:MucBP domain-containing protein [Streptococcus ruminantium]|uniref:MucBP domain-containing protein n=2 Tax=Streptococcus ruminantium TaxID=1917441 RepID=UPI0013EF1E03|nr:MucBP domain-containing protein [Streptococcus ruminantium]
MFRNNLKDMLKKQEYFSLRKFKGGLASVTVGAALFLAGAAVETIVSPQAVVVYAEEATYSTNTTWTLDNKISSENTYVDPEFSTPYATAETSVQLENGKTIGVVAKITPVGEFPEGIAYLVKGDDQSSYGALPEMFVGNPAPETIPALGIYVQPAPYNDAEQWDFSGARDEAIVTFTFSEPVTNPIIDLSGIGGSADSYSDTEKTGRGSFNSTILTLLTQDVVLEAASSGANLTVTDKVIEATAKNTYHRSVVPADASGTGSERYPDMVPAGTGSVRAVGTVSELSFKLSHSATPYSVFPGVGSDYTVNGRINGFNKAWSDRFVVKGESSTVSNADLFRLSVRLNNTKTGSVVINYLDTDGNILQPQYTDTTNAPVGTEYDTTENQEKPAEIVKDGKTYVLAPEGFYNVGEVTLDNNLRSSNLETFKLAIDAVSGQVLPGQRAVTYVYKLKEPVAETGDVEVNYFAVDDNGKVTPLTGVVEGLTNKDEVGTTEVDTKAGKDGSEYDTQDLRPTSITDKDGVKWVLSEDRTDGDGETGIVKAGEIKKVNYYYVKESVKTGSVIARYVVQGTETEIATDKIIKSAETPVDESYTDTPPVSIEFGDKNYTLVGTRNNPGDAPNGGKVIEGQQTITYEYKEVVTTPTPEVKTGTVLVRHITDQGEILAELADVVRDEEVGTSYVTSSETFEGYTFVKVDEAGSPATGTVEEGIQTVTYIYKKVESPIPTPEVKTGTVLVRHITDQGEILAELADVVRDEEIGTGYVTSSETFEGYTFVKVDEAGAPATGTVEEGIQTVTYIYKKAESPIPTPEVKKGSVQVRYITEKGEVLEDTTVVKTDEPVGTEYTTEQKVFSGYTFIKVDEAGAPAIGTVEEGTKTVTYIYKESETKPTPGTTILPETGESVSVLSLIGLVLLGSTAFTSRRRQKK